MGRFLVTKFMLFASLANALEIAFQLTSGSVAPFGRARWAM